MRPDTVDIEAIIEYLQGSCSTLDQGVKAIHPEMSDEELNEDEHQQISQSIFCCDTCNWWFEAYEENENGNCEGCGGDEEE